MTQPSSPQKHILLAEDDPGISDVVAIILQEEKYHVFIPKSFNELRSLVLSKTFDLILLDVSLWGEDASGLCKELKSNKKTKDIPVILISARSDISRIANTIGAEDTIEKPFEVKDMLEKVNHWLKHQSPQR